MSDRVSDADWWNERYQQGDTRWDKGQAAPPIVRMLAEGVVSRGPVAVLGAGRGHEAFAVAALGLPVTAIDFAPEACRDLRSGASSRGLSVEVLQEDVFRLPIVRPAGFAAALEHTCFCAIDPARREEYARAVWGSLSEGGLFFGLFYAHGRPGGPPFTTSEDEVRRTLRAALRDRAAGRAPRTASPAAPARSSSSCSER